jgi:hypothetical protein
MHCMRSDLQTNTDVHVPQMRPYQVTVYLSSLTDTVAHALLHRYPDQHTMCLQDEASWHCAALAGVWGDSDWSFGPNNERDVTMMGGMGVDLNETFTAHALPMNSTYGTCVVAGAAQWEVTRELSYLQGTVTGNCTSAFYASGRRLIGAFNHSCAVLTQITIVADGGGQPVCLGCRCCDTSIGCPILPP